MGNIFFISDTHFGHEGVCKFLNDAGRKLRPWDNAAEMDEALVESWNSVVKPRDKVYHLGDVAMSRNHISTISRCNGKKCLVRGNHDLYSLGAYTPYFYDVRGCMYFNEKGITAWLTHIPVHPRSVYQHKRNIHGHLHSTSLDDPRYICVSVEQINYTPIELEELRLLLKDIPSD